MDSFADEQSLLFASSLSMNQGPWFGEKNVIAGLLAGFFGGELMGREKM